MTDATLLWDLIVTLVNVMVMYAWREKEMWGRDARGSLVVKPASSAREEFAQMDQQDQTARPLLNVNLAIVRQEEDSAGGIVVAGMTQKNVRQMKRVTRLPTHA